MTANIAQKRVIKDLRNLERDPLTAHGIYVLFNEDNIMNQKVLMIGPKDTPYENGFFFFDIKIPDNYPFSPPLVKFCTTDSKVRFNPNLYADGKVCLSIINTWSGPSWTSVQTLSSVLLSIQSLLNEYPLRNEPGFENELDSKCKMYNEILKYETFRVAILNILKNIPNTFESFLSIINDYFLDNINWYNDKLELLINEYDKKLLYSPIYNMRVVANFKYIKKNLLEHYKIICPEDKFINFEKKTEKLKSNKCPTEKAYNYPEGYTTISDNDETMIYTVICDKNGSKKWKKKQSLKKENVNNVQVI